MLANESKIGYRLVYPPTTRGKLEAYYFCQCADVTGSIRRNKEGNLEFEISGYVTKLDMFMRNLNEYMGQEAIDMEQQPAYPTYKEGVFRIG